MTDRTTRPSAVAATPKPALRTPAVSIRPAPPRPSVPLPERAAGRAKPAFDTAAAVLLLVPALPLMAACVLLVRLT
ncbi:MAG TPA: hypothetical protein VH092_31485, partial [Urbifossiella sp.]|nr:hypothetical protein [Urbifossiella sp.]